MPFRHRDWSNEAAALHERLLHLLRTDSAEIGEKILWIRDVEQAPQVLLDRAVDLGLERLQRVTTHGAVDAVEGSPRELTPLGPALRADVSPLGGWYLEALGEVNRRARGDLLECVRTGESAIDRLCGKSLFEVWQSDPEQLERANTAFRVSADTCVGPVVAAGGERAELSAEYVSLGADRSIDQRRRSHYAPTPDTTAPELAVNLVLPGRMPA